MRDIEALANGFTWMFDEDGIFSGTNTKIFKLVFCKFFHGNLDFDWKKILSEIIYREAFESDYNLKN